jgi:hypothetical protein
MQPRFSVDASAVRKEHTFKTDAQKKYNLCVNGLGFISLKGMEQLTISVLANTKITLLTEVII